MKILKKLSEKVKRPLTIYQLRKNGVQVSYQSIFSHSSFEQGVIISQYASVHHSSIASYSSIGRFSKINNVHMGKYCSISWDVTIGATSHPLGHLTTHAFPYVPYAGHFVTENTQIKEHVNIGNDVWVGTNSVILPGVTIGDGAVIGAGSVVTKDVPPYAVVTGVPAKVLKYRFNNDTINHLKEIQWWNWDRYTIKENIDLFQQEMNENIIEQIVKRGLK